MEKFMREEVMKAAEGVSKEYMIEVFLSFISGDMDNFKDEKDKNKQKFAAVTGMACVLVGIKRAAEIEAKEKIGKNKAINNIVNSETIKEGIQI